MSSVRFIDIRGRALPLDRADIDTDQILPAHWLTRIERTGFAAGCFEAWRRDPRSVLNDPTRAGAAILVAGPNFGCGSSREHAVWALLEYGFKAVISPRFASIFRENALNAGLLPIELPASTVAELMQLCRREPATEWAVDVQNREIRAGAIHARFTLRADSSGQVADDIAVTLLALPAIEAHEAERPAWMSCPGSLTA